MFRIEGDYLVVDSDFRPRKVTGRSFVSLVGLNPFQKEGDALLTMHKLVKEEVDPKWLKRGDFAEALVKAVYERDGHKCTVYDKKEVNYDNFTEYKNFGGLIDIELLEEKTLIEVKSKSLDKYDAIKENPPREEVYQGLFYGFLRKYDRITMEWVFFDPITEDEVFKGKKVTTLRYLKKISKKYDVDKAHMRDMLCLANQINKDFEETHKIRLSLVSDKMLKQLGLSRPSGFDFSELNF